MKTIFDHIRQSLLAAAGVDAQPFGHAKGVSLEEMRQTEWSPRFEILMRNRLLMGRFRYGAMKDPAKGKYDNVGSAVQRIGLYLKTGNQEHLVDAANLLMVEFEHPNHPNPHFSSSDDSDVHAEPL